MSPSRIPSPHVSRRGLFAAGGALAATAGLAGCGLGGTTEIIFSQRKREAVGYFGSLLTEFEEANSGIRVTHDIAANLSASFVRKNPPDIACENYNFEMIRFLQRGGFSDLADMPVAKEILPEVKDLVTWYPQFEDRTSVMPFSVAGAAVIYNRRIFEENGLEVPTTWDEFVAVCETLQAADIIPIYGTFADSWTILQGMFDYTVGGMMDVRGFFEKLSAQGAEVGPDSEVSFQKDMLGPINQMLKLLPFHQDGANSRVYGDGNTAMANGEAAMLFQGPWALAEIAAAESEEDLSTFPLPSTDDPEDLKIRVNIDLALWIPVFGNKQEECRELLSYLMTPEVMEPYNEALLAFNTTQGSAEVTDPRIAPMYDYYTQGKFYMGASQLIPLTIPWSNYLQSIVYGADPEPVLARLDSEWASLAYRA